MEEELGGSNPKVFVRDANGREWLAKWAEEVHSEVFASRLAAAAGYFVRTAYFVPGGRIEGCRDLQRAGGSIDDGGAFEGAVFKLIDKDEPYLDGASWAWDDNPFLESRDGLRMLNGLKIMLMLTSNWDAKDLSDEDAGPNTAIYQVRGPGHLEHRYAFDDWGGSMGRWGGVFSRSKWDSEGYSEQSASLVEGLDDNGFVRWGYKGKNDEHVTAAIRPEDVDWLLRQIGPLEGTDIQAALEDAGADNDDVAAFGSALKVRLRALQTISSSAQT